MDADVVVIGAGALGLSTALHCALAGRSVIVLDRHEAGSQASGRAAGLFKSVQADELRTRLYRAIYGDTVLSRYAMDPQKPIRIVVDNGHVTLYGAVSSALDKQLAGTRANGVSGVFSVDNQLVVAQ